jgi:hypothetical protein
VDPSRLASQGYGPTRPLDTNETEVGRQNNRRVEFHIVERASDDRGKVASDVSSSKTAP